MFAYNKVTVRIGPLLPHITDVIVKRAFYENDIGTVEDVVFKFPKEGDSITDWFSDKPTAIVTFATLTGSDRCQKLFDDINEATGNKNARFYYNTRNYWHVKMAPQSEQGKIGNINIYDKTKEELAQIIRTTLFQLEMSEMKNKKLDEDFKALDKKYTQQNMMFVDLNMQLDDKNIEINSLTNQKGELEHEVNELKDEIEYLNERLEDEKSILKMIHDQVYEVSRSFCRIDKKEAEHELNVLQNMVGRD